MISQRKHKMLSKLIAFTFAFNTIVPVAFASEETVVNNSTATTTNNSTSTSTSNSNSNGLSLNSIDEDILTRMASNVASEIKKKNLNISASEVNSLLNIPLSTEDDESSSYKTQAEKDYEALQLLIAKGYNNKEKRQEALEAIEKIETAAAEDSSVGGLTDAEKYVKKLLEEYEDIESRANLDSSISSAITTTDSAITAYKTILKVARMERLACRNDALAAKAKVDKGEEVDEGTNTDPDKCALSARGEEAAQMLTAISNQQVNQTTDSKKKANSTNATATTTASGETQYACNSTATPYPAINDKTKCCVSSQKPYYKSSTNTCVASLVETTNSNNNRDDDDDDDDKNDSSALLMAYMMSQQNDCKSPMINTFVDRCVLTEGVKKQKTKDTSSGKKADKEEKGRLDETKSQSPQSSPNGKRTVTGNNVNNSKIMSRISDIRVEFSEPYMDEQGKHIHISDSNTEYKMTVTIIEKETNNDKSNQQKQPLSVNVKAYQFLGSSDSNDKKYTPYAISYKNVKSGTPVTIVYPTTYAPKSASQGQHFVKLDRDNYFAEITITDGTDETSPFYAYYKIVTDQNRILSDDKDQNAKKSVSILDTQGKNYFASERGYADLKVLGAKYENGICKVSVEGNMVTESSKHTNYKAEQFDMASLNDADCNKLNEDAKSKDVRLVANNARISAISDNGSTILEPSNSGIPGFVVNGENQDTAVYLPSSMDDATVDLILSNLGVNKDGYGVALGNLYAGNIKVGGAVAYKDGQLLIDGEKASSEDYKTFFMNTDIDNNARINIEYDANGKATTITALDKDGNVISSRSMEDVIDSNRSNLSTKSALTSDTMDSARKYVAKYANAAYSIAMPDEINTVGKVAKGVANRIGKDTKDNESTNNKDNTSKRNGSQYGSMGTSVSVLTPVATRNESNSNDLMNRVENASAFLGEKIGHNKNNSYYVSDNKKVQVDSDKIKTKTNKAKDKRAAEVYANMEARKNGWKIVHDDKTGQYVHQNENGEWEFTYTTE